MDQGQVMRALDGEVGALVRGLRGLSEEEWERSTRCGPWRVRDLLGHVHVVVGWLPGMLAAPAPPQAEVSAVGYYRPDGRFAPQTNAARIGLAQRRASATGSGDALVDDFAALWRQVDRVCQDQPRGRVVRTRHGDAMLLSEFLLTRLVEVAVHGLDLADALERKPWLTQAAGELLVELLVGPEQAGSVPELGWDTATFVRKATGRELLEEHEALRVRRLGLEWLTLG
ncbi:MAG TPA: maleylpyruvate isomerase N-terminal domain-containing protein [Streptomyces sp.]|nr:maleylpyruvate isomerase N-terminal domain-containing protein [Streptomyces sp.]